jgi:hypothetical protein
MDLAKYKNGPSVNIDDFTFMLHASYTDNQGRHHVVYSSSKQGETKIFFAYKSMSEGFWKYKPFEAYWKCANDYVTCTFLHMDIQCLCEKNYSKLPQLSKNEFDYSFEKYKIPKKSTGIETIAIESRKFQNDKIFETIRNFSSTTIINKNKNTFYSKLKRSKLPTPPRVNSVSPRVNSSPSNNYKNQPHLKEELYSLLNQAKSSIPNSTDKEVFATFFIVSNFIQNHFEVDLSIQEFVCTTDIVIHLKKGGEVNANQNEHFPLYIYKTHLTNKESKQTYDLFYACYTRKGTEYKAIVNIVPTNEPVLKNGLYAHYVSASPYIYKIFDYAKQCTENSCMLTYKFLGDELTKIFPLPQLDFKTGANVNYQYEYTNEPTLQYITPTANNSITGFGLPPSGFGLPNSATNMPTGFGLPPPGFGLPNSATNMPTGFGLPPPGFGLPNNATNMPTGFGLPPRGFGLGGSRRKNKRKHSSTRKRKNK